MNPMPEPESVRASDVDPNGRVNYATLKAEIAANGPYSLRFTIWRVDLTFNITPCTIEGCACTEDVISITQSSGFTSLSTLITREQLESYESLSALAADFLSHPQMLFRPFAEQQYIEGEIRKHLGVDPREIYENGIPVQGIAAVLSEACIEDPWRAHNLHTIFRLLLEHRKMLSAVGTVSGDVTLRELFPSPNKLADLMGEHYRLGFLIGRLISEHFIRYQIEPFAQKGLDFEAAQQRRTEGSGKRSSDKRHLRIEAMLTHMERLIRENKDMGGVGLNALTDLAIKNARKEGPTLWRQGRNQKKSYLDELKSDIRYRARFHALSKKIP